LSLDQILAKLDAIEAEMKRIGYWQENPPVLASRSFLEIGFELWLQQVFLPDARERARTNNLPKKSPVGLMAMRQYDYHSIVSEAHPLMQLLFEFDELIEEEHRDAER
jgi:uncharacterized protein YqcC (DUF446 family)